ncbi:hypothetical protein QYE76_010954 [Lolium multiflorum]|uniref:Uncharacterized protein n=1 Tax=Lolium multiflorum TaxID=4521 RepID=A0AAD8TY91_LOLMU|nr:hypothetical protein QYE76_010954 [Lolium multiflorum]
MIELHSQELPLILRASHWPSSTTFASLADVAEPPQASDPPRWSSSTTPSFTSWATEEGSDLERDLDALSEFLERPHPEFFGAQVNDQPGGELQWVVVAPEGKDGATYVREDPVFREGEQLAGWTSSSPQKHFPSMWARTDQGNPFAHCKACESMGEPMDLSPHPDLKPAVESQWNSARAMNVYVADDLGGVQGQVHRYHVPLGLIKKMRDEFRELKQGRMSVWNKDASYSI